MPRPMRMAALSVAATALVATLPASAVAGVTANPTSLSFPSQSVGTTAPGKTTALTIGCDSFFPTPPICALQPPFVPAVATTGDFAQTNDCPPVILHTIDPPELACTITVTFKPTAAGARTGTLSTGASGPSVPLSGIGVSPSTVPGTGSPRKKKCKKHKKRSAQAAKKKCKKKRK